MQKSILPLLAVVSAMGAGMAPRYLNNAEDVRPILKQYQRDPFRYTGVWSVNAKDPFELDLKADTLATPQPKAQPKASANAERTIGGQGRSTPGFLHKVSPLLPNEAIPQTEGAPDPLASTDADNSSRPEYNAAPQTHYLRPYLLATASFLSPVSSGKVFAGECALRYSTSNESEILQPFEEVELGSGSDAGVKPGDLFKLYEVGEGMESFTTHRDLGRLVRINGMVEVLRTEPNRSVARVTRCFGTISRTSRAAPIGEIPVVSTDRYVPAEGAIHLGRVIWVAPPNQIPQPFTQVIIDQGEESGFQVGDFVFIFNRRNGKMTDKVLGNAVILHTDAHSATLLLQDVEPGIIDPGDFAVCSLTPTR